MKQMVTHILRGIRRATGAGEPSASSIVWERERRVLTALKQLLPEQPYNLAGRYSWLTSAKTGCELQLDIFFPEITEVAGIVLATPAVLAVEVQSSLHDGKWNKSKRKFFRTKEDFLKYTQNQEWKRAQLLKYHIPFLEIDPSVDDLSPRALRKRLSAALGLLL